MNLSNASTLIKSRKADLFRPYFARWEVKPHLENSIISPINSVGQILSAIRYLPKTAVLLGKCPDGIPIFLDLGDSSIGSVLVISDEGYGKTHQLQVMVESGIILSSGEDIQVAVISKNPWEWKNAFENRQNKFLLGCYSWHEVGTDRLISNIFDICEERLSEPRGFNNILFILDDLDEITHMDKDYRLVLEWLFDYGPKVNIWPIASICSAYVNDHKVVGYSFKTNIIGKGGLKKSFSKSTQVTIDTSNFDPGEFTVMLNSNWITYRLPMLGK